jgi:3-hexulose-6-phosphate synthase/6-phospho-3-hexuloisomerase
MKPIVQVSLDLTTIEDALDFARLAVRAGVDWLEAGTPLLLGEGIHAVRALRNEFPNHPVVADAKIMDGGYLEVEMLAQAGATHVVVMARAHPATIRQCVKAGRDFGVKVMGDDLGADDKPAACRMMQELGVDFIVHHVGFDERRDPEVQAQYGGRLPNPLDELAAVVAAVDIPVQAVGGLSMEQAIAMPLHGAPLVVLGAPLVIDADAFKSSSDDVEGILREIVTRVRANGERVAR